MGKNIRGENSKLMRLVGCIPIPENDMHGTIEFMKTIKQLLSEKCWLHIYPEGSMWEFYKPIRPF